MKGLPGLTLFSAAILSLSSWSRAEVQEDAATKSGATDTGNATKVNKGKVSYAGYSGICNIR